MRSDRPGRRPLLPLCALAMALALGAGGAAAQELNCNVTVNRQAVAGAEFGFLDEIQDDVRRYLNDRAWTQDRFEERERIDCSMQIVFRSAEGLSRFNASLVVQASRPIYGTAQPTTLLLINDDAWEFNYVRGQSLVYDPERFDAFTSVLDFYAFLILGYDYDSFSELGGTPYFELARRIANRGSAQNASGGWGQDPTETRSRLDLVRDLLDPRFQPLRQGHFAYHFGTLDSFLLDREEAWDNALVVLEGLHRLFLEFNERRYATDVFFVSKFRELTDLLVEAPNKNEAYALLAEMDPAHLSTYDALVRGR